MNANRIILGLLADGSTMTQNELIDATGWGKVQLIDALDDLISAGQVKSIKRHCYKRIDIA